MKEALERLAESFSNFADELRGMTDDLPQQGKAEDKFAGYGEERDDNVVGLAPAARVRDDVEDDKMVTLRSGDLRKVIDAYRKLVRYAREGRIPHQDERFALHQAVRNVKHLIRKPRRDRRYA